MQGIVRYRLTNYGSDTECGSETHALCTLAAVKELTRGEFSICEDLVTGEVFEPYEKINLHN